MDGIFVIDGVRRFRGLCKIADIEKGPNGRLRSPKHINSIIQTLWDEKREVLEATMERQAVCDTPVSHVMRDWAKHTEAKGRAKTTLNGLRLTSNTYLEIMGDHAVGESSTWHADKFLQGLRCEPISEATLNSHLNRISTFWRYCHDRELIERLPRVTRVKVIRKARRVPKPEDISALIKHLDHRIANTKHGRDLYFLELHRLLVFLLLGTGMRSGEAISIHRENIDLKNRAILLEKTKTNQPRICRIPQYLAQEIEQRLKNYPFHKYLFGHPKNALEPAWRKSAALTRAFTRHFEEIGIKGEFKPLHGFRALFATAGLNNVGVDPLVMMNQIGHSDIKTTQNYYVASMQDAQLRAVDAMEERFFKKVLEMG